MEGKLRATLLVSLALALSLGPLLLVARAAGAAPVQVQFTTSGTHSWVVPSGVTAITVEAWGGGGAGGGSTNAGPFSGRGGGGGGGGAYASSTLSVTAGQTLSVVVGAGGVGVSAGDGGSGGDSYVGPSGSPLVRAAGGSGGTANTAGGSPPGGAGGAIASSIGQTRMAGEDGDDGDTCFDSCSGAGGDGGNVGGSGGAELCGPFVTAAGNPGAQPGGGGGGGRTSQYNGARAGGAGGVGKVVITYEAGEQVCATIFPTSNVYDLANPGDVTTLITWNDSASVASIHDGTGYLTAGTDYTVSSHDGTATLTIKNTYLAGKLTAVGQSVALVITFDDDCEETFTISAVDTSQAECATISPTSNVYDLANPGDVTTLITWNDSASVASIHDGTGYLTAGTDYAVSSHDGTATLTIKNVYLAGKLTAAGQNVALVITFDDDCEATFTITAVEASEECATISPTTGQYDLASPGDVSTTITWNDVTSITSIHDGTGYLTAGTDYTVSSHDGTGTLTIKYSYLAGKLTATGQSVVLTINCDINSSDICATPFIIMALGEPEVCPTISPTSRQYDLASPANQTTTITWNDASSIVSVVDGSTTLTLNTDYTVSGNTLTILNAYLAGRLTAAGQSVTLTINFDICTPPTFTITAIDSSVACPTISPTSRQYDLASPANQTTTITWNDASSIVSIVDNGTTLTLNTHYTVAGSTLTILNAYLAGKLTAAGQSVTLTISFDICTPCPFTITAIDSSVSECATISPTEREYNLADPDDVNTLITWRDSPHGIASIYDGTAYLAPGTQYTISPYNGTARLIILNAYLAGKLTAAGQSVVLTITFDDACVATLSITAVDEPVVVGLTGYQVNKLAVMAPWTALLAAMVAGVGLLMLRRRRT